VIDAALPTTNSEIEREFNCTKRLKTDLRNKLSVGRIQNLIQPENACLSLLKIKVDF